jgi:hypothetical protein
MKRESRRLSSTLRVNNVRLQYIGAVFRAPCNFSKKSRIKRQANQKKTFKNYDIFIIEAKLC